MNVAEGAVKTTSKGGFWVWVARVPSLAGNRTRKCSLTQPTNNYLLVAQ